MVPTNANGILFILPKICQTLFGMFIANVIFYFTRFISSTQIKTQFIMAMCDFYYAGIFGMMQRFRLPI